VGSVFINIVQNSRDNVTMLKELEAAALGLKSATKQ